MWDDKSGEMFWEEDDSLQIGERSSITSARLGGVGGLNQNADTADALEGGGGVKAKMLTC